MQVPDALKVKMRNFMNKTIVIAGPTASGKTGVAIEIAKEIERRAQASPEGVFGGFRGAEVISADSRAIYRGMDIGTAKPGIEEQQGVPHWGLDLVKPGERFTVADWKRYAEEKITEIRARGDLPIVVGGTGLYIDALVYNYSFSEEGKREQSDRKEVCSNYLIIGVKWDAEKLRARIAQRVDKLFVQELFDETKELTALYNWNTQAMKSNIYQFAWAYLQGEYDLGRAKELCTYDDWHLAKRQLTWFKRNKNIVWLPLAEIEPYVIKCIQDEQRR